MQIFFMVQAAAPQLTLSFFYYLVKNATDPSASQKTINLRSTVTLLVLGVFEILGGYTSGKVADKYQNKIYLLCFYLCCGW